MSTIRTGGHDGDQESHAPHAQHRVEREHVHRWLSEDGRAADDGVDKRNAINLPNSAEFIAVQLPPLAQAAPSTDISCTEMRPSSVCVSSSLKFDSFWANLVRCKHFGLVERATSDYFLRGGVRTPRNRVCLPRTSLFNKLLAAVGGQRVPCLIGFARLLHAGDLTFSKSRAAKTISCILVRNPVYVAKCTLSTSSIVRPYSRTAHYSRIIA